MRANTSLFGHILGDHPQINGYYEMHIGYYSWKSLIRQKLIYAAAHPIKPSSKFFFDKILHSEHYVDSAILNRPDVMPIFSIRKPSTTIPSIIKLYQKVDPTHEFATKKGAINYYIERTNTLAELAKRVDKFTYIDADAIRDNTQETLGELSSSLQLSTPLSPKFKKQKLTGVGNTGDHSGNLLAGAIKNQTNNYDDFEFSEQEYNDVVNAYSNTRKVMSDKAITKVLLNE